MTNNDIIRRLRYAFDLNDQQMIDTFKSAEVAISRGIVSDWLKKDDHEEFKEISDQNLCSFLDGLINVKRGRREGPQAKPLEVLDNNNILRKLKIAINLKDTEMLDVFKLVDMRISKHELSAFFRKPTQNQYRDCKDQFLRNFIYGLQVKYRGRREEKSE